MKILSTKTHAFIDYGIGLAMIVFPFILSRYAHAGNSILILVGILTLLYSILTNNELGLFTRISMKKHLLIDIVSGIFLGASPWLFSFSEMIYFPHLIFGIVKIIIGLTTSHLPSYKLPQTNSYKRYDMPVYGKHENFPSVKF